MQKPILIALLAGLIYSPSLLGTAQQATPTIRSVPVKQTSPASGEQMYTSYCAPCHGVDGRGNGPAASALKNQPMDLTGLAKANHGKFPDTHIVSVLKFGSETPAHGSAQMPVWGPILGRMNQSNFQEKELRVSNLSRYLKTIQVN